MNLPEGKRKRELQSSFEDSLKEDFHGRIFPFDTSAARSAGRLAGKLRKQGRELEIRDLQIAGIVAAQHASLVTRNVKDFRDMGISVINPWPQ
ncbi:MAG: type II toxin-antitoxin system VapC family toxin [Candidatus Paceibacterota bacterium]